VALALAKNILMLLRCRIPLANFELDVDATFDARVTSVFGPSGSGKTSLLDAIAGLRKVTAGEIEVNGRTLFSSAQRINCPARKRGIGYVPQEGALFPHLSVRKNILFGSDRRELANSPAISMDHVVEVLEISNLLGRPVTQLSGGEAQRVALARAVLSRPQLLLLDEPLAALDIGLRDRILPYLGRVRDEFSIPMIYVTHNLTEVLTLADWVLVIRQGRLVTQGLPQQVLRSPRDIVQTGEDPFENIFDASFVDSDAATGRTRVRLASGQELFVPFVSQAESGSLKIRISPDDILIGTQRPEGISAANVVPGTVKGIETLGGEALITVSAGDDFYVRLTLSAVNRLGLAEQAPVFLIMKTRSFRLL
jgi:molybdate transport system ATP-binding protein